METFLEELKALLEKYDASIIRSAKAPNKLVLSAHIESSFQEIEFEEDITVEAIKYEWYT